MEGEKMWTQTDDYVAASPSTVAEIMRNMEGEGWAVRSVTAIVAGYSSADGAFRDWIVVYERPHP